MAFRVFLSVIVLLLGMTGEATAVPKRILLLHSFGRDFSPWAEVARSFRAELDRISPEAIEFHDAALATERFGANQNEAPFVDYLDSLFAKSRLDLIVAIGAPAARFVQRYRQQLFPSTPMLFTAVEQRRVPLATLGKNDTLVAISTDFDSVIENIMRVRPGTTDIAVVIGNSPIEKYWLEQMRGAFQPYANRITFTFFNDLSFDEMLKRAAALPSSSAIFFGLLSVDAAGHSHEATKSVARLRAVASAPIFHSLDTSFGDGIVGGPLISLNELAQKAADAAMRILSGEVPNDIKTPPIVTGTPKYDWRELQRWDISESQLPSGSEVYFRVPSMWEQYKSQLTVGLAVLLLQAGVIFWLLFERGRRFTAEAEASNRRRQVVRLNRVVTANVLSSSIAHELNQPLGAILSNTEAAQILLKSNPPDLIQIGDILGDIVRDEQRASEIIVGLRNLLNNRNEADLKYFDLNDTVEEVVRIVAPEAARRKIALTADCSPDALPVRSDPIHLQQVMLNLAVNGMDAMEDCEAGPRNLKIRTQHNAESGTAEVTVADSGKGIPEENLTSVFDAFFTTKPQGTGLGLPIARTIIQTYGGTIWAENRDRSAVFSFRLPLSKVVAG
jgi:signal transduction histidine kinase